MANWSLLQEQLTGLPVAKRAKHGIHFQRPDGLIEANFTGKPCHYQDGGLWKPIDTRLIQLPDGWYGAPHSDVRIHPDGRVKVEGTNYQQRTELPTAQTGLADDNRIVRRFAFGEQSLFMTEDGFRSEITLNRIPTLAEAKKLLASESGALPGKYQKHDITAIDAEMNTHIYSTLAAFRTWLASAKFPVVIDPDFGGGTTDRWGYGHNADYATARTAANDYDTGSQSAPCGQYKVLNSEYHVWTSLLLFNTSSIEDGQDIVQTNLNLTAVSDDSDTDSDIVIVKYDWTGVGWQGYQAAFCSGTLDNAIWRNTSGMSINTRYASGNLDTAWVSKTGTTYYIVGSGKHYNNTAPTGYEHISIAFADHTTEAYRPVLTALYTAAGCPVQSMYYIKQRGK